MKTTRLQRGLEDKYTSLPYATPEFALYEFVTEKGFASSEEDKDGDMNADSDSWHTGTEVPF